LLRTLHIASDDPIYYIILFNVYTCDDIPKVGVKRVLHVLTHKLRVHEPYIYIFVYLIVKFHDPPTYYLRYQLYVYVFVVNRVFVHMYNFFVQVILKFHKTFVCATTFLNKVASIYTHTNVCTRTHIRIYFIHIQYAMI